jgi:hypothetical protein
VDFAGQHVVFRLQPADKYGGKKRKWRSMRLLFLLPFVLFYLICTIDYHCSTTRKRANIGDNR